MSLSNPAKMLRHIMATTGVHDVKTLASILDIPVRTIQRLKLEVAVGASANDAINGAANDATGATDGATGAANDAINGASPCNLKKEIPPTPPKEKTTLPRTTLSNSSEVAAAASARKVADAALLSDDDLEAKLIEACNGALDNPANCSGLLNLSIPKMWLREGADLDGVVLPTLRAAGKRYHGKRVRDWSYFTGMVTEAKNRVAKGLPEQPEPAREGYGARALAAGARRRAAREAAAAMEAAHG